MYCSGGHLGFPIGIKNIKFVENLPMIIPGQFGFNCPSGFREEASDHTEDYKIGIYCFSAKRAELRSKSNDWLTRNQNNVSSGPTCRHADCCLIELALKNPTDCVELFLILITKNTTCGHIKNV
jgi:hypothetical protein